MGGSGCSESVAGDRNGRRSHLPEDHPDDSGTYPIGLETPARIPNIQKELVKRGCPAAAMAGIPGHNWIDLFKRVWATWTAPDTGTPGTKSAFP